MRKVFSFLFILPVRLYQLLISPLLPNACRHSPTCSAYTIEAIKIWGPFKGIVMGIKRLSRCHPWGTHGYDPVPKPDNDNSENNDPLQ
ncbi:MAG: membrane protein insertion efficiency factor YidD [Cryomorphaceae bacterium]|nr:membrane protein insertion efficiency factor YidD [Cryomorphaceae bacterium]